MLAQGRGRWAISQKCIMNQNTMSLERITLRQTRPINEYLFSLQPASTNVIKPVASGKGDILATPENTITYHNAF